MVFDYSILSFGPEGNLKKSLILYLQYMYIYIYIFASVLIPDFSYQFSSINGIHQVLPIECRYSGPKKISHQPSLYVCIKRKSS